MRVQNNKYWIKRVVTRLMIISFFGASDALADMPAHQIDINSATQFSVLDNRSTECCWDIAQVEQSANQSIGYMKVMNFNESSVSNSGWNFGLGMSNQQIEPSGFGEAVNFVVYFKTDIK